MAVEIGIGLILLVVVLVWRQQTAKAWQGDPSNAHTKMGSTLIKRSMFNRLAK